MISSSEKFFDWISTRVRSLLLCSYPGWLVFSGGKISTAWACTLSCLRRDVDDVLGIEKMNTMVFKFI